MCFFDQSQLNWEERKHMVASILLYPPHSFSLSSLLLSGFHLRLFIILLALSLGRAVSGRFEKNS